MIMSPDLNVIAKTEIQNEKKGICNTARALLQDDANANER